MTHGTFVWADLSTFRPEVTEPFYAKLFGWRFDEGTAFAGGAPVAALFTMPDKFQEMGMPSFWMSYIAVDDAAAVAECAKTVRGRVEFGPAPYGDGTIALIRDPLGAGLTVYEGSALAGAMSGPGARVGHGLFVSDASKVETFYSDLFAWSFGPTDHGIQAVSYRGQHLFHCHSIPDEAIRGKEEFWAVFFEPAVADANAMIRANGGEILAQIDLPEGPATIARDPDGGVFFLLSGSATHSTQSSPLPWKAWAGLALVLISSFTQQLWPWAIFLGAWMWSAWITGTTYLFEPITRPAHPRTFLATMIIYAALLVLFVFLTVFGGP